MIAQLRVPQDRCYFNASKTTAGVDGLKFRVSQGLCQEKSFARAKPACRCRLWLCQGLQTIIRRRRKAKEASVAQGQQQYLGRLSSSCLLTLLLSIGHAACSRLWPSVECMTRYSRVWNIVKTSKPSLYAVNQIVKVIRKVALTKPNTASKHELFLEVSKYEPAVDCDPRPAESPSFDSCEDMLQDMPAGSTILKCSTDRAQATGGCLLPRDFYARMLPACLAVLEQYKSMYAEW